jgi:DNA-dependent protein kinase catalytic subunit
LFTESEIAQSTIFGSTRKKDSADLGYLSSQYLSDSSLSSVQSFTSFITKRDENNEDAEEESHVRDLEMDEVNLNPSMRGFVAAIEKLSESPDHKTRADMPGWMSTLHDGMSTASHINISIFLGRVICNMSDLFDSYASHWWRSIARLIGRGEEYGSGIHQFIHDLCLLLLTWDIAFIKPDITNPDSKDMKLIGGMFRYLANNSGGKNRVFNQKMLRLLVERFSLGPSFHPPTDILQNIISSTGTDQQADLYRSSGLMFISILICNEMDPYNESQCKFSRVAFMTRLVKLAEGGQAKSARLASGFSYLLYEIQRSADSF